MKIKIINLLKRRICLDTIDSLYNNSNRYNFRFSFFPVINTLDSITEYAEDEKTDQALEKIKEFSRSWKDYYICVSFLVESSRLEDISASCAKLEALLLKNSEELYSECETIKYGIKLIYNNEFPYLHSIF